MFKIHHIILFALIQPLLAETATLRGTAGTASATTTVNVIIDADHDGLLDSQEDVNGNGIWDTGESDFKNVDTDGDGLKDKEEVDAGKNPLVNQFTIDQDWSFMPTTIVGKTRAFWDFEAFDKVTKRFADRKNSRYATTMPLANWDSIWNQEHGMMGKSVSLGGGADYLEIHPDNLWTSHRSWNVSFTAKFAEVPSANTVTPLFSVYTSQTNNSSIIVPPAIQASLVNGVSMRNSAVRGLLLRLHGSSGLYGEWLLPSNLDLNQWSGFSFNSNGTYHTNDRWCFLNGIQLTLITGGSGGYAGFQSGASDANSGYILLGATKTTAGVISVSSLGISLDRLTMTSPLSIAEMKTLTSRDTDGDGLSDTEELRTGSDPTHFDNDADRDGLTNAEEIAGQASFNGATTVFGVTKRDNFDSDGDLFDDYWEAKYFGTKVDPNDPAKPINDNPATPTVIEGDYDSDGLSNYQELVYGTDPNKADTDDDGVSDKDEAEYGSSATDSADKPLNPHDFYGDEGLGSYWPIGDLGTIIKAGGEESPVVYAQVGDESNSHSERWRLLIGEKQLVATTFGELSDGDPSTPAIKEMTRIALKTDDYHAVTLRHVATAPGQETDYDYTATVTPGAKSPFILCDPYEDRLLGVHNQGGITMDNSWAQKTAYLVPLDNYSWSTSYSGGDAVGPRYRKVALNGRPIADEKPQQEAESDLPEEETYVDAFNLGLHHDMTFAYTPLGASELVLQASASVEETGFSDRSGLRPNERFDQPFGVGWTSNLCSYIEVVENIGAESDDPVAVNVVDEAGRPQRFGTRNFQQFFPWPSSRTDKKTYLNTLTRNGANFTLKKKFGNTLTYVKCKTWLMYGGDRIEGSTTARRHTYWRLAEVQDRYGVRLQYDYDTQPGVPNDVSLIPRKISSPDREGQWLVIERSPDSRRVEAITDARGNTTHFNYDTTNALPFSGSAFVNDVLIGPVNTSVIVPRLTSVTFEDQTTVQYAYNGGLESATDTSDPQNPRTTLHYHVNLKAATDKRGNTHTFHYAFDTSKQYWDSSVNGTRCLIDLNRLPVPVKTRVDAELANRNAEGQGLWKTMFGMPRKITSVNLPGTLGSSSFSAQGQMRFGQTVSFTSAPRTTVTDAAGNLTVYDFSGMLAEIVDVDATAKSISKEWMVYYLSSSIHHGGLPGASGHVGTESYQFDPSSGLSLWRATDLSGNVTRWEYSNAENLNDLPLPLRLHGLGATSTTMTKWADPIAKIDALGRRETYTYSPSYRVMDSIDDPYHTTSSFVVDGLGRRKTKSVLQNGVGTPLAQERYDYNNIRFKAFQTGKSTLAANSVSGQAWETDLKTAYLPDTHGRLWREINDPEGEKLTIEHSYDFNNNRTSTLDARGNRTRFTYDKLNRLIETTYPSAGTRSGDAVTTKKFWYNENGSKAAEIDEEGHYTIHHYDALNRRTTTIRDMDGQGLPTRNEEELVTDATKGSATGNDLVTRMIYNKVGSVTHQIDPRGIVTRTFYDAIQRPIHVFTGLTESEANGDRDACTAAAAASDEKTHTEFLYTDSGLTFPRGGVLKGNPGGSAFDSSGFKPTIAIRYAAVLGAGGTFNQYTYAAYDELYRPVRTETEYEPNTYATSTSTYGTIIAEKESLQTTTTDDRGKVTRTVLDGLQRPLSITDAFGTALAATTQTVYSSTGLIWKTIDPMSRQSETEYDKSGRSVAVWQPDPVTGVVNRANPNDPLSGSPRIQTAYDKNNNVTVSINPLGYRWEYQYDARNRKTAEIQPTVTQTEIINGQPAETPFKHPEIRSSYDGVGNVIAVTNARDHITRTFHDFAYRVTDVLSNHVTGTPSTDPANPAADDIRTHTVLDANGNALSVTDGNGNKTCNSYDRLNRLVSTATNPVTGQPSANPASPSTGDITVFNQYDDSNNLVQVTDGEGHVTGFRYDGLARKTRTLWDEGSGSMQRAEQTSYDGLVQITRTDPKEQVTTYQYDARHRLENVIYAPDASGGSHHLDNQKRAYDSAGKLISVKYPNEPASLREIIYTYDALDRINTETSAGVTHSYPSYDKAGNRLQTVYGRTNRTLVSTYDALNRLLTLGESGAGVPPASTTSYGYDLAGNTTRKSLPNGSKALSTFDALNRKLSETTRKAAGGLISSFDYSTATAGYPTSYDKVGNLLKVVESYGRTDIKARTVTNTYDRAYRLATENMAEVGGTNNTTAYQYDKANNRTSKVVTGSSPSTETSTYGNLTDGYNSNQLKSVSRSVGVPPTSSTITFQYDLNGNRKTRVAAGKTDTYIWDHENRLVTLTYASGPAGTAGKYRYAYDYRSRRVIRNEKEAGAIKTSLSFSGGSSAQEYQIEEISDLLADADSDGQANWLEYAFGSDPLSGSYGAYYWPSFAVSGYEGWAAAAILLRRSDAQISAYRDARRVLKSELIRGSDYGGGIGVVLYTIRSGARSYNAYNSRGDVVSKTDDTAAITWQAAYEAFGTRTQEQGTTADRQKANTKDEDPTGLLNEGMRYRDLEFGIFLTRDPAGFVDGPNVYTYVRQNPWTKFDPLGLAEEKNDKNLSKIQLEKMRKAMADKVEDLYDNHDNQIGDKVAGAKQSGKELAYCNKYPSECVAAGYEAVGMPETAKEVREKTLGINKGVLDLAKLLQERGWSTIFYNTDTSREGSDGSHKADTGMVQGKNGKYWGPMILDDKNKPKGQEWLKVDGSIVDFKPGRPGYSTRGNEELTQVDFAVIAGSRGRHGAVMSNGGFYDVHRSEADVKKLYQKNDFNMTSGFTQSGLMVIPPGSAVPTYSPTKP